RQRPRRLGRRGAARSALAILDGRAAAGGRSDDGEARARERGSGDVALARRGRSAALVPLARHARQRDRLGRHPHRVPAAGGAWRDGRGRRSPRRAASSGPIRPSVLPRRGAPLLALRARGRDTRSGGRRRAADCGAAAGGGRPRRARRADGSRARRTGGAARRRRPRGDGPPRRRRGAGARLVAAAARRPQGGLARRRPGTRRGRRAARAPPRGSRAHCLGARRTQPAPRRPAPASLAPRGARAHRASRPAGLRGRGTLRGTGGRQASDAIRSSTDLNTNAPTASATAAATTRYSRSPVGGSSPSYSGVRYDSIAGVSGFPQWSRSTSHGRDWAPGRSSSWYRMGVRKNHGSSAAVTTNSTSRKIALSDAIASATPAVNTTISTATGSASQARSRLSGWNQSASTRTITVIAAKAITSVATTERGTSWRGKRTLRMMGAFSTMLRAPPCSDVEKKTQGGRPHRRKSQ